LFEHSSEADFAERHQRSRSH